MERIKLLLADGNRELTDAMAACIMRRADMEVTGCISDGGEVMDAIARHIPDVVVMDLILPRCDGFVLLEKISRLPEPARPKVIILTTIMRDDMVLRSLKLGASYYMVKPFDMQVLAQRICETAQHSPATPDFPPPPAPTEGADQQITNLFLTLGIPAHIKGYQYLREAVRMVISDHSLTGRITKELYPGVAARFGTSASKVERAMRHAIEVAWNRGRLDTVNKMYGYKLFEKQDKPSNGEFISCIAEKIGSAKTA